MLIQPNMPVSAILATWPGTVHVFERYGINADSAALLNDLNLGPELPLLIEELNSTATGNPLVGPSYSSWSW